MLLKAHYFPKMPNQNTEWIKIWLELWEKSHTLTGPLAVSRRGLLYPDCREYFYSVIFEISDKQMQFAGLKNTPKQKKNDTLITLINQSQEIRPQGLDLGRSTSIRGCTSAQIKTLRPYFSIFSITVVRICLRKQQSKFFTNMLTTPSIEPANIWFDSASPWLKPNT